MKYKNPDMIQLTESLCLVWDSRPITLNYQIITTQPESLMDGFLLVLFYHFPSKLREKHFYKIPYI